MSRQLSSLCMADILGDQVIFESTKVSWSPSEGGDLSTCGGGGAILCGHGEPK